MHRSIFGTARAVMLTGIASIAIVGTAQAAEAAIQFNIPAQSLDNALKQFALKTNKDLLYSPEAVSNRRVQSLSGRYTPTQALKILLKGTGLTFSEVSPNVFALRADVIVSASTAQAAVSADDAANTGVIYGTAVNSSTGSILPGAIVRIQGTNLETVTDERGQYYFPAVPRGSRTLEIVYLGDATETVTVNVTAGARAQANFQLGATNKEIVVFGFRSSTQKALNQQKNASNNATIISADALGQFPAENVAEALRRVSGVAFGRAADTGEGSRITIRGFSSEAINVQLNGLDLQGTGFTRTIDLSGFLADNISQVVIQKSLLPSHESTGSGGLVEIETKSGLDYGKFAINLGIEGELNGKTAYGNEFQANGTIAGQITSNFGIAATVQYRKTDRTNFNVDIADTIPPVLPDGFTSRIFVFDSFRFPFDPEFNSRLVSGAAYSQRNRDEESLSASLNLAWDIGDHTRLRLDLQRNQRNALTETSRTVASFLTRGRDMPIPELGGEVRRRTTLNSFRPFIGFNETDSRFTSDTISFRGDTILDRWTFNYKFGYSKASSRSNNINVSLGGDNFTDLNALINPATIVTNPDDDATMTPRVVDGGVIFTDNGVPIPSLTAAGLAIFADPTRYNVTGASRTVTDSPTTAYFAEGSVRYEAAPDFLEYVEVGFKYDRSSRTALDERFASESEGFLKPSINFSRIFGRNTSAADIDPNLLDFGSLAAIGVSGFALPSLRRRSVDAVFDRLAQLTEDDPNTAFNEERFRFTDASTLDPINDTGGLIPASTTEARLAGYFEAQIRFGDFDLSGGVRMERTRRNGRSLTSPSVRLNLPGFNREPRATFVAAGLVQFADLAGTTTTWTPSALLNYRPTDNIKVHLAYFRTTINPSFRQLRNPTSISIDLRTGNGSVSLREANPGLRPSTTDSFDFDVSYFFQDNPGLIRAGLFYRKISRNFTNVFFQNADDDSVRDEVLAFFAPLTVTRPDLVDFAPDTIFTRNRPENGEGGVIWGFELELIRQLDFLPGFLKNFSVLGNLTYTDGDFPTLVFGRSETDGFGQVTLTDRPLQDQPQWAYNIGLNYSEAGFDAQLIYTKQTQDFVSFNIHDVNTVTPAFDTLDLRVAYNFESFGGNWTIFLEGDDLLRGTNSPDIRTAFGSSPGNPNGSFFFPDNLQFNGGRTLTMGVRARF